MSAIGRQSGHHSGAGPCPLMTHSGHAAPFWLIQIMKLAIRLGLRAAHEEAFLDDLTVPDRV